MCEDLEKSIGKIIQMTTGSCLVHMESGEKVVSRIRGKLRLSGTRPFVGDNVILETDEDVNIVEILPRRNALVRPPSTNIDLLLITIAPEWPAPSLHTIDQVISVAEYNDIEPIIVITKRDLNPSGAEKLSQLYKKCGFNIFVTCSTDGFGLGELSERLKNDASVGKSAIFCGISGVGKSTLLNAMYPTLDINTATLGEKSGRGRHTTRAVTLYPANELYEESLLGYIGDTPGFSLLDFDMIDIFEPEELYLGFREFVPATINCKYKKCTHLREDGCGVLAAIQRGEILSSRHESYVRIFHDVKNKRNNWK